MGNAAPYPVGRAKPYREGASYNGGPCLVGGAGPTTRAPSSAFLSAYTFDHSCRCRIGYHDLDLGGDGAHHICCGSSFGCVGLCVLRIDLAGIFPPRLLRSPLGSTLSIVKQQAQTLCEGWIKGAGNIADVRFDHRHGKKEVGQKLAGTPFQSIHGFGVSQIRVTFGGREQPISRRWRWISPFPDYQACFPIPSKLVGLEQLENVRCCTTNG